MIQDFQEVREPKFRIRRLDKCGAMGNVIARNAEAAAVRLGFQVYPPYGTTLPYDKPQSDFYRFYAPRSAKRCVAFGGGHRTFEKPLPAAKYFKDHPEYFALVDGKRQGDSKTWQYCISNPEVQRLTAESIIRDFDRFGGKGGYLFGMVDSTHGWCECENCRALDPVRTGGIATPNVSTRFNLVVKNMADMIWAKYPKANLSIWAYHTYRELPVGVRQDPRMKVNFCDHGRCYGHRFDDPACKRNADMLKLMRGWLQVTPQVYTYEYFTCTPCFYLCHEFDEVADIRFYASLGVMGWKNEASFSDSAFVPKRENDTRPDIFPSNWQWLYLTGKALWDPDLDEKAVMDEAEAKYYGEAYPAMKKYQALRRKLWANNPNCLGFSTGDQRRPALLDVPGSKQELLALLDEADKLATDPVTRHRVGLDRRWLTDYWIKPNDENRAKQSKAFRVPRATGPIVLDGVADEGAWSGAHYCTTFVDALSKKPMPEELATSVGMLFDDDNLYFVITAMEPTGKLCLSAGPKAAAWQRDSFEFMLKPPSIDNRVYHFAANADGRVWAATDVGGVAEDAFGMKAAARVEGNVWTIEIRLPTAKIHPLKVGDTWTAMFGRNREMRDRPERGNYYTSEGCLYADSPSYRPFVIGAAYLRNGGFADLDADGKPKFWGMTGKTHLVPAGLGQTVVLNGTLTQTMDHKQLHQCDRPRKLTYSFVAKGPGKVDVRFYRYVDTHNPKAKYGYDRKLLPEQGVGGTYDLGVDESVYAGEYTVPAGEWCSIVLRSLDDVTIKSVTVTPLVK